MVFTAHHGVYDAERANGNTFTVNVTLHLDTTKPQQTDALADTLDYQSVFALVQAEMVVPANLLENVAQRIKNSLTNQFKQIDTACVEVIKHNAPINGFNGTVSVEV